MNTSEPTDPFEQIMPTVHEAVRKSLLLKTLHDKLQALPMCAFPFAAEFGRLRDWIAPQIGDTRILFPEFTPHDEALHVVKLFQLSDKLFGTDYKQLNAAELFLLGCALYAHDWGMAVGLHEKEYLRHGASKNYLHDTFSPLPDESERLEAFIRSEGLQRGYDGAFPDLSDHHLRLYVRLTHARRSGARVRAHFQEYPAVGEALACLCEGHWHDFATLDDPQRFPREYEVGGHTTHLLALALQVRLIDLFHITDDRTPYALWRFVSPKERHSEQEWKKHRALHGVAIIDFPPGRAIKVQGFTEDEEVWASLEDLRRYCENQIHRTLNLCARHIPQRYMLNFLKLEWAVTTGTLRPVDLAFSFDSKAMFRILSEDIYDGDRYVFLRELLQNSIDAIRMRRSRHEQRAKNSRKKKQFDPLFDTTVYITAEHQNDGDIIVTCRDYGIGMDEHIIRHYFTVAGVSYYRSEEFERQQVGFEPVSRFGIGILSCFMVADKLEVKTYRDPECGPLMTYSDTQLPGAEEHRARRLHLIIPSVERQFIVKDLLADFQVGTEISLRVLKEKAISKPKKLDTDADTDNEIQYPKEDFSRTLKITEYLCEIAGFVEFPIFVEESWPGKGSPKFTLILHPDQNAEINRQKYDQEITVHQLLCEYPWDMVTAPENVTSVREFMVEHRLDLHQLLGDSGYEGWVVFPGPPNEEWDFGLSRNLFAGQRVTEFRKRSGNDLKQITVKLDDPIDYLEYEKDPQRFRLFGVYRDGILLREIERPRRGRYESIANFMMHVNLSSSNSPYPNVSRTKFESLVKEWDSSIWTAIDNHLCSSLVSVALDKSPAERLYHLGWIKAVFHLDNKVLTDAIPTEKMVMLWLMSNGKLDIREAAFSSKEEIPILPRESEQLFQRLVSEQWNLPFDSELKIEWNGPSSLGPPFLEKEGVFFLDQFSQLISSPVKSILELLAYQNEKLLVEVRLQFLEPPKGQSSLICQSIYVPHMGAEYDSDETAKKDERRKFLKRPEVSKALEAGLDNPNQLELQQRKLVAQAIRARILIPFGLPFSKRFACYNAINSCHPFGKALLCCLIACCLAERDERMPILVLKEFQSLLFTFSQRLRSKPSETFIFQKLGDHISKSDVIDIIARLIDIVESYKLIEGFVRPSIPDASEFVPNIQNETPKQTDFYFGVKYEDLTTFEGGFGKLITEWPLINQETQQV